MPWTESRNESDTRRGLRANNPCGSSIQCAYPQEKVRSNGTSYYHKCGQCLGCRVTHAESWAVRNILEARHLSGKHYFVTLTYTNARIPFTESGYPTARIEDVRKFVKRFRRKTGLTGLKYFAATEYGKQKNRPHAHLLLFGIDPDAIAKMPRWVPSSADQAHLNQFNVNWKRYNALEMQILRAWRSQGQIDVQPFNENRAAYVAKYVVKGDVREGDLHPDQQPESRAMSKGLGKIGAETLARQIDRAGFALPENRNPIKWTDDLATLRVTQVSGKTRTYPMPDYIRQKIIKALGGDNRTDEEKLIDQISKHNTSLLRPFTQTAAKAEKAKRITIKCLRESGTL